MKRLRWPGFGGGMVLGGMVAGLALAQDAVFDFNPAGGRTILSAGLAPELATAPELTARLARGGTGAEWLALILSGGLPGITGLDEWQARTLADYLAYAAPVDPAALPPDGRDMALARCQSCHIITVVVTQARTKAAWLGTLAKPSHVGVPLSPAERDQLADYLEVNAGLPIDAVPPALRAGGASY